MSNMNGIKKEGGGHLKHKYFLEHKNYMKETSINQVKKKSCVKIK